MFRILGIYLAIFLFLLPSCIYNLFGKNVTLEQILFHIDLGFDGVKGTDSSIILPVLDTLIVPFVIIAFYFFIKIPIIKFTKKNGINVHKNKVIKGLLNIDKILKSNKMSLTLFLFSLIFLVIKTDLIGFLKLNFGQDFFSSLYASPKKIAFAKDQNKKNLLIIYVESLENNLKNQKLNGVNLIEPIENIKGVEIPKFYPAPGTGWSIAGMVSSQCGVPLKLHYGSFPHENGSFLPNLICLGDILKQYGYKQYFLAGHQLGLSGTGNFYKSHGYEHIFGTEEWKQKQLSADLFTGFGDGLNDDTLLNEAKKIIIENNARHQNFNLALITVDTHAKEGFPSPRCTKEEKSSGYRGAFRCASQFVANFIGDLESKKLLDNTVVVILGDHPFMESPDKSKFFPNPRYIYIKFIDPENKIAKRDKMTHFDVAPSILDLLGFLKPAETKFGLGFSVFADIDKADYEKHFLQITNQNILYQSSTYDSFW